MITVKRSQVVEPSWVGWDDLSWLPDDSLGLLMQYVLESEDYMKAALIRDEKNRRLGLWESSLKLR